MIVAERKPLEEIEAMLGGAEKLLVVGCGTCVAVCMAGGEKEVELLATELRLRSGLSGRRRRIDQVTLTRQCDREYLEPLAPYIDEYDAIISMACGAGVQLLAERFEHKLVLPALNTRFIGVTEGPGQWSQRCLACGQCLLHLTGGICPITLCPKNLLNGPCGGTNHGKCEVNPENPCAWTLIYHRLEKLGRLDLLEVIQPPKDYRPMTKPARLSHPAFQSPSTAAPK
ncbi:MAG: methylenetetrahydrofolate reductase C-terminal domain-containing protein [Thermoguttaceae bacterium]|nr:methylenetetrahydrofolate reductase C-terminal domain-containing protein [Thermoguttaceae bacterium]MDW8036770.1 methylenetetrahydrofolate reductase C-terminal domain-containing protein [Thermoguttaceae bacterium]